MISAVQSPSDWLALILDAEADIKANKPLPPAAPMTEAQLKALLSTLQAKLPEIVAEIQAHPGYITAADRVLSALAASGRPWAVTVRAVVDGLPGGLATALQFMPFIAGMIDEFSPATGGYWSGAPNAI